MTKYFSLAFLLFSLSACAVTHHGYRGPGNAVGVKHANLYGYDYDYGNKLTVIFEGVDGRAFDPDLPVPKDTTLTPGTHKVLVKVLAEKDGVNSKTEMEFDIDAKENASYFFKGSFDQTHANIWVEDQLGNIVVQSMPAAYSAAYL